VPASFMRCRDCVLYEERTTIVDGNGPQSSPLFVVGEAPGEREDKTGIPFVGSSGQLLRTTVYKYAGGMPVYFTNSVRCRPPGNRDPRTEELGECRKWLVEELREVRPTVVLALGKIAAYQVGQALEQLDWVPEYYEAIHPAATLSGRSPEKRKLFEDQVRVAVTAATGERWIRDVPIPEPWEYTDDIERIMFPTTEWLAADTETDSLEDGIGNRRVGWSVSDGVHTTFTTSHPNVYLSAVPHVYLHNAAYDLPQLGLDPWDFNGYDDTMLMCYVYRYWERVGLKEVGPRITGIEMEKIGEILGTGKKQIPFSEALRENPERSRMYAAKDALITSRVAKYVKPRLEQDKKLWWYYRQVEKPLIPIIIGMQERGVMIDREKLREIGDELDTEYEERSSNLRSKLGIKNLRSPIELPPALREYGVELNRTTQTGRVQQDKTALLESVGVDREEELDPDDLRHYIVSELLGTRQLSKLKGTYIDAIGRGLDPSGAIHGRFNQAATATNRLSSSDPNLQNIPNRTATGKRLRELFVARNGFTLVRADFSQAELRIFAEYTKDPLFLSAYPLFGPSKDLHQMVADRFAKWGVTRKTAKNGVFGTIYGAEEAKLGQTFGIPKSAAGEFMRDMKREAPALVDWRPYIQNLLLKQGYVETILGWRNYYPMIFSPIGSERQAAIREAANMPIQGTVAGIMKVLMYRAHKLAVEYGAYLLLQVHDEVVYECPTERAREFGVELAQLGRETAALYVKSVPLELTVGYGRNWREAA
jgi:uracil-DNA glycosylase family 4